METATLALHHQIPLSPSSSLPWVANNVMVHAQFQGGNSSHVKKNNESLLLLDGDNKGSNDENSTSSVQIIKTRKRPAMLVLPEYCPEKVFASEKHIENVDIAIQGKHYCLLSKKGRRKHMEDRYKVITQISGHPNQAFFAVIDGHGGEAAADYVAENLGKNILDAVKTQMEEDERIGVEKAIREGYLETDRRFLSQMVSSGACAASVLIKNNQLHAANVGDCRVVLSRSKIATALTNDHHLSREDERSRVENSGGFLHKCNGVWRLEGTLAVSRAIGDMHLKQWIISDPYIHTVPLTADCDLLILASDGLWDKVSEQEAVDFILREEVDEKEACKKLVDLSNSRGNRDDITVIVINLQQFVSAPEQCVMVT